MTPSSRDLNRLGVYGVALAFVAAAVVACQLDPGGTYDDGTGTGGTGGTSSSGSSTDRVQLDVERLCGRLVNEWGQGTTLADCRRQYVAVLVTSTCASALTSAACADLISSTSSVNTTCFPACSGALASCNGDGTITICTESGTTTILSCAEECQAEGTGTYKGTCGQTLKDQTADRPQCWCE